MNVQLKDKSTFLFRWTGSGVTLGSAVTASMNLTNSTDPLETSGQVTYKTESAPDMQQLYYQVGDNVLSD